MTTAEVVEPHAAEADGQLLDTRQIQTCKVCSTVIPIGRPLEEQLQSQQHVSQCPGPRFFLTKLNLDRNVPNLVFDDPNDDFKSIRAGKNHVNRCGTQLMRKFYSGILSFYEFDGLTEAVEKGDHRVVKPPVVENSSEVEVT